MQSGKQMNRLLQGDVGSGKTAVAAAIVYSVAKNGLQSALMAPTEVLATQHFETFKMLFENTGIRCELLTGSTKAKEKKEIKERLKNGEIDLIIGTGLTYLTPVAVISLIVYIILSLLSFKIIEIALGIVLGGIILCYIFNR